MNNENQEKIGCENALDSTLRDKRKEWTEKWLRKPVTARCIAELKEQDKEFIQILLKEMPYEREFIENLAGKTLLGGFKE